MGHEHPHINEHGEWVDPDDVDGDVRRTISETADPIRLKTQLKRGEGTRDQDTIEVKVRGDDPEEAVGMLNDTLELLRETADTARDIQPGGEDDG